MTPSAPACAPPRQAFSVCVQRLDLGGPVMERLAWPTHAWIIDRDELHGAKESPIVLTRTYRCLRCGEAWSVSGEPAVGRAG